MREFNRVDLGSIRIHNKALAEIVLSALAEVDGVSPAPKNILGQAGDFLGFKNCSSVGVSVDKNNQVVIDVNVAVRYGLNIPDVARQAQDVVRDAIERTADIDLKDVNINVQGIERRTP